MLILKFTWVRKSFLTGKNVIRQKISLQKIFKNILRNVVINFF